MQAIFGPRVEFATRSLFTDEDKYGSAESQGRKDTKARSLCGDRNDPVSHPATRGRIYKHS